MHLNIFGKKNHNEALVIWKKLKFLSDDRTGTNFIAQLIAQWRQENISYKFLIVKGQKYRYVNIRFYTWDSMFSAALVRVSH